MLKHILIYLPIKLINLEIGYFLSGKPYTGLTLSEVKISHLSLKVNWSGFVSCPTILSIFIVTFSAWSCITTLSSLHRCRRKEFSLKKCMLSTNKKLHLEFSRIKNGEVSCVSNVLSSDLVLKWNWLEHKELNVCVGVTTKKSMLHELC